MLAGTIRRTGDDAHDLALAASLARSSKDLEEHEYAVRSVADALAPHCSSMNVPETPFVLHLPNVMHLATDVAGVAGRRRHLLGPRRVAAPDRGGRAGRRPTVAVAADRRARGHGPRPVRRAGRVDGRAPATASGASRCAAAGSTTPTPRAMRLFAGCGIVAGSDPEAELAEAEAKFVPMRDALSAT